MASSKPSDLGELVNQQQAPPSSHKAGGLEKEIQNEPTDSGWNFKQVAKDVAKFSPFAIFNYLASGGLAVASPVELLGQDRHVHPALTAQIHPRHPGIHFIQDNDRFNAFHVP